MIPHQHVDAFSRRPPSITMPRSPAASAGPAAPPPVGHSAGLVRRVGGGVSGPRGATARPQQRSDARASLTRNAAGSPARRPSPPPETPLRGHDAAAATRGPQSQQGRYSRRHAAPRPLSRRVQSAGLRALRVRAGLRSQQGARARREAAAITLADSHTPHAITHTATPENVDQPPPLCACSSGGCCPQDRPPGGGRWPPAAPSPARYATRPPPGVGRLGMALSGWRWRPAGLTETEPWRAPSR